MKKIHVLPIFSIVILLFISQITFTSCKEENVVCEKDTVTVLQKDTVTVLQKDTALTMDILTANPWKLQEYKGISNGMNLYYYRGGTNNTESFDNEYIVFKSDKTGTYYTNSSDTPMPLTWEFASTSNTKIVYTVVIRGNPRVVTWDDIVYKNKSLKFTQSWSTPQATSFTYNIRIPK